MTTNPQPTPPEGYEMLDDHLVRGNERNPELRGLMASPKGKPIMTDWKPAVIHPYKILNVSAYFWCAPLGTTALLITPGPEVGECNCGYGQQHRNYFHFESCPAHPRNAYVKVLPGWLAGLKEKPEGLLWANHMSDDWTEGPEWFPWDADSAANATGFIFAVPRYVFDRIEAGRKSDLQPDNEANAAFIDADRDERRSWSRDPIHDEVAKMDESKLQAEQISTEQESEVKPCATSPSILPAANVEGQSTASQEAATIPLAVASNAAPADGPNPSPGAAELLPAFLCNIASRVLWLRQAIAKGEFTPAEAAKLNRYTSPLPFEKELLSGQMEQVQHAIGQLSRTPPPVAGSGPTAEEEKPS